MRRPKGQTVQGVMVPAPVGGTNTVDVGGEMPPLDAIYVYNMIAAEHGLRSRLGFREWVTGLTGGQDSQVRTVASFTGSAKSGSQNKLFAMTSTGIWDVSSTTTSPTILEAFPLNGPDAGVGSFTTFATPAGRFLIYCDEENGLYLWSETGAAWTKIVAGVTQAWTAQTLYFVGNVVKNGLNTYICDTEGTSAASGGPTGVAADETDGTTRWDYVGAAPTTAIGTGIDAQNDGLTCDPTLFAQVCVFKNRLWFVERNTSRAWYLDANAIYGTGTAFDFGSKMRAGGPLRGLFNWTYDGGGGIDSLLVGISGAGDIVIYQGTDPDTASTFGLKGCWFVGAVPSGRRIASDYGGDLLIMSLIGVVPLSRLVTGVDEAATGVYATRKIANLFNQLTIGRAQLPGWAVFVHPQDNALMVTVPTSTNKATEQLAMSFGTKGWSRYRDLPIYSATIWDGELYFGTADGRVCRNTDYVDDVKLADSTYTAISWSVLTAYRNLGNERQKQVKMLRPILLGGSTSPTMEAQALYDFNMNEPAAPGAGSGSGWDTDLWDTGIWGGDFTTFNALTGAVGMGKDVAIAVRGTASTRTVLVGVGVQFEQGGML